MKKWILLIPLLCINVVAANVEAKPKIASKRDKRAITRVVITYIGKNNKEIGPVVVRNFDVQGNWALVVAAPKNQNMESAEVLLRKQKNIWKVLTLGTGLHGVGVEYGVPKYLRNKWGL